MSNQNKEHLWMELSTEKTPLEVRIMRSFMEDFFSRPAYEKTFSSANVEGVYQIVDFLEKIRANVSAELYHSGLVKEIYQAHNPKGDSVVDVTRRHSYYLYGHNVKDFES